MVRTVEVLVIGGVLVIIPLGMGGIPLIKLLFFALAVLIGAPTLALRPSGMAQRFLFTFFAVVFLSPLWSVAPFLSVVGVEPRFEGMMAYIVFLGLALVAGGIVRRGYEQNLLQVILWSNVGVVFYGLLQVAGMDPLAAWWDAEVFLGRVFSTVGQPNFLGQFLLLTAPFTILTAWRRGGSCVGSIVTGGNLLVLLATGSRAAMLGVLVAGSFYLPSRGKRGISFQRPMGILFLICVVVIGFFLFSQRFAFPGEAVRSIHARVAIWEQSLRMIHARPTGWGLETTGIMFPHFQSASLSAYESLTSSIDRAHSKPLDLLLTVGPLGLLSYYVFFTMLITQCLRAWQRHCDELSLVGAVSLIGVSVSLLFGFEGIVVHAFFWLICGMLLGRFLSPVGRELEGGGRGVFEVSRVIVSIFCLLLFVVVVIDGLWLHARFTMERAEHAFREGNFVAAVQTFAQATYQAPWDRALLVRFLETTLLARERTENRETKHALDTALGRHFRSLQLLTNRDPLLPSLQAWKAALQGEKKEALVFLDEAKIRAPFSIPRLRIAAHVAQLLGDKTMENALRTELKNMLPSWWGDARDPRRRILLKENPWLEELFTPPSPTAVGEGSGERGKQECTLFPCPSPFAKGEGGSGILLP